MIPISEEIIVRLEDVMDELIRLWEVSGIYDVKILYCLRLMINSIRR